jgi:restriction endonuclease
MFKQTAVEWLLEQVNNKGWGNYVISIPSETIQQAKAMEKEQIKEAYYRGDYDNTVAGYVVGDDECEDYYNETYGGSNE